VLHLKFLLLPKMNHSLNEEFPTNRRACILMHWICGYFKSYVFDSTCKESHPMICLGQCRKRGEVRGIASSHLWSAPRPGRFTSRKDPAPIVTGRWVGPGPVLTGAVNLAVTRIVQVVKF